MIPNKTEEQILLQNFKYHDLEGLGYCNLRTFIKTHERLGVVLSKIKDIEEIFNHYDHDGSGRINYKQFCSEIFNPPQQQQPSSYNSKLYSSPQQQQHNLPQSFIDILNNHLLSKGGSISLMQLLKEIQIIDYNNSNKITIDDFVKILRECGITLHQNDYQLLFGNYELFANGILYYNELLRQLLLLYWSDARETYTNELYDKNKGQLDIKELKRLLPKYNRFIEYFKFVCKSYGEMSPLNPLEFKNFVKYFSYGIDNDDVLYNELLPLNKTNVVPNKEESYNRNELKEAIMNNKLPLKQYNQYQQQPQQQIPMKKYKKEENKEDMSIIEKFVYALGKVNRRTLFSFIKHFRYYEDDFQCVSKYDFLKIIKDYRIDLSLKDIEKLFYEKSQNIQKTTVHYEKLFKEMIAYTMTVDKIQAVKDIYDQITQMANDYNCDEVTIDFIKQAYKSKHNILNQDESNCKIEFDECIELFHFCYKGYKGYRFTKEEFVEFYSFISLLLKDDNDFISLIQTEFKPQYGLTNNNNNIKPSTPHEIINNQKQQQQQFQLQQQLEQQQQQPQYTTREAKRNITNNGSNVQSSILSTLEQILIHRGIRGLIYLHRQFLNSCSDLNHITLDTFIKVLQLQHIFLPEEQYSLIYNNFLKQDQTFDFFKFIRSFKQELNEYKLQIVEDAFSVLDVNQNEQIDIDFIKMNYIGDKHPDVIEGKKHCEEVVLEFYDAFELNYTLLAKEQYVNFEIFANYYEYVAFVYKDDKLFERVVKGDWGL